MNWTDLQQVDPVTRHVAMRLLVTRVSVTTSLAAAKLGRLVLDGCSRHIHSNAAVHTGVRELQFNSVQFSSCAVNPKCLEFG